MLHSISPSDSPRIDFVGRDLYTADNQWIGVVRDMRTHPRDGSVVLIIHSGQQEATPVCVRYDEIGVVTPNRIMLDVLSSTFERDRDSRYFCPPEFLDA